MESIKEGIRRNLVELLANSDKKKSDLARSCGVGRSAVTNWINGSSSIDIERIPAICDFFEVSVDEFFGRSKIESSVRAASQQEIEMLALYRSMPAHERELLLETARTFAQMSGGSK